MATGVATATEATATEAMGIEVVGAVTADGTAAAVEVVAWEAITGAAPAPAGRVEPLLCRSGRSKMKDDSPQEQDAFLITMRSDGTSVSVYHCKWAFVSSDKSSPSTYIWSFYAPRQAFNWCTSMGYRRSSRNLSEFALSQLNQLRRRHRTRRRALRLWSHASAAHHQQNEA